MTVEEIDFDEAESLLEDQTAKIFKSESGIWIRSGYSPRHGAYHLIDNGGEKFVLIAEQPS
jgi:hypothetical protein